MAMPHTFVGLPIFKSFEEPNYTKRLQYFFWLSFLAMLRVKPGEKAVNDTTSFLCGFVI